MKCLGNTLLKTLKNDLYGAPKVICPGYPDDGGITDEEERDSYWGERTD